MLDWCKRRYRGIVVKWIFSCLFFNSVPVIPQLKYFFRLIFHLKFIQVSSFSPKLDLRSESTSPYTVRFSSGQIISPRSSGLLIVISLFFKGYIFILTPYLLHERQQLYAYIVRQISLYGRRKFKPTKVTVFT